MEDERCIVAGLLQFSVHQSAANYQSRHLMAYLQLDYMATRSSGFNTHPWRVADSRAGLWCPTAACTNVTVIGLPAPIHDRK